MHILLDYISLPSIWFRSIFVPFSTFKKNPHSHLRLCIISKSDKEKCIRMWKWHYPFWSNLFSSLGTTNFTSYKTSTSSSNVPFGRSSTLTSHSSLQGALSTVIWKMAPCKEPGWPITIFVLSRTKWLLTAHPHKPKYKLL
jgi:hypothetical protein